MYIEKKNSLILCVNVSQVHRSVYKFLTELQQYFANKNSQFNRVGLQIPIIILAVFKETT
jgi:hypothetical protein